MANSFHPARLDDSGLEAVQSLEECLGGKVVVALEQPSHRPAALSADELEALRDAEQRLGCVLVAYDR